jgi:hypothetical protein
MFKLLVSISFLFLCIPSPSAKAQNSAAALKYMESINKELNDITTDMWDYTSAAAHGKSARKVENRRKDVLRSNMEAQKKIGKMPDFEGDKSFRDSVVSFLRLSYHILNNDFAKIVDMEEIAEQSYDAMEAYLTAQEKANQKLNTTSEMLTVQQQTFATTHGITLSVNKDKISQKLESAGEVYSYYNVLYLLFFKPYKQEAYLIDALNKGDVNALKQDADALGKCADLGLSRIDSIQSFKGDGTVKTECKNMLHFYKTESGKDAQTLINYSVKKENFEKIKTSFEAKPQNKRTQADVNSMNSAVTDFNKASAEYNKVNEDLNKKRTELLNKWSDAVARFIDKQVPTYK